MWLSSAVIYARIALHVRRIMSPRDHDGQLRDLQGSLFGWRLFTAAAAAESLARDR